MRRGRCVNISDMRKLNMFLLMSSALFFAAPALAQSGAGGSGAGSSGDGSEISLYVGSLLPNQIEGVTEILPVLGGRYGFKTGSFGVVELGLSNSHAEGADFTTLSGSLRADLPAIDQFVGIVYGGLDVNYYRGAGSDSRKTETGLHFGTGLMYRFTETVWFRTDLSFMVQPGTSLSILAGLVFKTH